MWKFITVSALACRLPVSWASWFQYLTLVSHFYQTCFDFTLSSSLTSFKWPSDQKLSYISPFSVSYHGAFHDALILSASYSWNTLKNVEWRLSDVGRILRDDRPKFTSRFFVSTNFGPVFSRVTFRASSNFGPHAEKSIGFELHVCRSEAGCCSEVIWYCFLYCFNVFYRFQIGTLGIGKGVSVTGRWGQKFITGVLISP